MKVILERWEINKFSFGIEHALEIIENTVDHPLYSGRDLEFARYMVEGNSGMHHFHVFDESNTLEILAYIQTLLPVRLVYFASSNVNLHFCLEII